MRVFALQLNNDIKGVEERKVYIESLIASLPAPDLVVLPELSACGYMASRKIWDYADPGGKDTASWAVHMAKTYHACIGAGYLDRENGDYYNRYLIAGPDGVFGTVTKSEGEAAVFKRGSFPNLIKTPFGTVAAAICYDSRRRHFYDNIQDKAVSLILFPHGAPADPAKAEEERRTNDYFCGCYEKAFGVPVVYVNSVGALEPMPGMMGKMMESAGFRMNGRTKIYASSGSPLCAGIPEAVGLEAELKDKRRQSDIRFYGEDINKGNWFFRTFILKPDTWHGVRQYEKYRKNLPGGRRG